MKNDSTPNPRLIPELIAYLATLSVFFAASFFPQFRVWGISWWAYFSVWVKLALLAIGIAAPYAVDRVLFRTVGEKVDISPNAYRWLVGGFGVIWFALFYLLRAKTFFLGDGYTLLSSLGSENPIIKSRNLGGTIFQYWIMRLTEGKGVSDALLAYQIISYVAGILFFVITVRLAAKLCRKRLDRLLFVLTLSTGAYALLFFGYVENYSLFAVSVVTLGLAGWLSIMGQLSRWWVIGILAVAVFLHVFGVALIPAALFVLAHNTPVQRRLTHWPVPARLGLGLAVGAAAIGLFAYFYTTSFFFRLALLPLVNNMFTVSGYTIFSVNHLLDFVNLLALLSPGLLIGVVLLVRSGPPWKSPEAVFLIILLLSCLGVAFLSDPKLGMPRDWDLFAFAGVPLVLCTVAFARQRPPAAIARLLTMIVCVQVLALFPRAAVFTNFELALRHVRNYIAYDNTKSGPLKFVLLRQLESRGDTTSVAKLRQEWEDDLILFQLENQAKQLVRENKISQGLALLHRLIQMSPNNYGAWGSIGQCYLLQERYDSAIYYLRVADAFNPLNKDVSCNLGVAYYTLHRLEEAEACFRRSSERDTLFPTPLFGLAAIYRDRGETDRYLRFVEQILARPAPPAEIWIELISYYMQSGDPTNAQRTLRRARMKNLSAEDVQTILQRYPQLSAT